MSEKNKEGAVPAALADVLARSPLLDALSRSASLAVVVADREGKVESWNAEAERVFGWTGAEALGRPLPPSFLDNGPLGSIFRGALSGRVLANRPAQGRRKNGEPVDLRVTAAPIRLGEGAPSAVVELIQDVTEEKRLEQKFLNAEKIDAIGRMAGGLAHDFNDILAAIMGLSELALKDLPAGSQLRDDLTEIRDSSRRAARLTQQLLAFSRRQVFQPAPVSLNDLLRRKEQALKRSLGEGIHLTISPGAGVWPVHADAEQLEQLLRNLCHNAREAMPGGGSVSIMTSNLSMIEGPDPGFAGVAPDEYVRLEFSDSGAGMTAEAKRRLFEPFFTTKTEGKGAGLGLATCYGIVKQHGGAILAESEPGRGTVFTILLPRGKAEPARAEGAEPVRTMPGGSEPILVVEDDAQVRSVLARVLRRLGYKVVEAPGAAQALAAVEADASRSLRLVISDVVMPKGDGKTLGESLRRLRPDLPIVFTSGYAYDVLASEGRLEPGLRFIAKPYTFETVARKVREALDAAAKGA